MHSKLALPSDLPEDPDRLFVMTMAPFLHIALILIVALVLLVPSRFQKFGLLMPFQGCSLYGGPEPEVIALEVDFDGRYMWDGALLANRAALTRRLAGVAAQPIQAEVHVRVNMLAPYGAVTDVMAAARTEGVTKLALTSDDQARDF